MSEACLMIATMHCIHMYHYFSASNSYLMLAVQPWSNQFWYKDDFDETATTLTLVHVAMYLCMYITNYLPITGDRLAMSSGSRVSFLSSSSSFISIHFL